MAGKSTAPALKAALLTRLATKLAPVQVSWGNPYPNDAAAELVIIGKATGSPGQEPATLPLQLGQRDEEYTLELMVSVVGPAQESQQTLEERAYAIAADIEDSLLDWASETPAFGGLVSWALVESMSDAEALAESGTTREASVIVSVGVSARI